jgi:hypothetical protein
VPPKRSSFSLDESRVEDIVQVSQEENDLIIRPFTCEVIRGAIFQMEYNKAPGPDGFSAEFYQACWEIIKDDLMVLFQEFHDGNLPLYSLNFGTIILLPKNMVEMNPFGENRTVHSTWPVILALYNIPTWLCHKRKYLMLSILIQGPKQAGTDIDIFLEPLMEDMAKL